MTCPECGAAMQADEVTAYVSGRVLAIRIQVCTDKMCALVVIVDWRWKDNYR